MSVGRSGGYLAGTVGGLIGATLGAWIGWLLLPLLELKGDPDLGAANLAIGLAVLLFVVGGGMIVGELAGIGVGLRIGGHRAIAATLAVAALGAACVGTLLIVAAAPLAVAVPLLAGVPAGARWLVLASTRRHSHGN